MSNICDKCGKEIKGQLHAHPLPFKENAYSTCMRLVCEDCSMKIYAEELAKEKIIEIIYGRFLASKNIEKEDSNFINNLKGKNSREAFDFICFLMDKNTNFAPPNNPAGTPKPLSFEEK